MVKILLSCKVKHVIHTMLGLLSKTLCQLARICRQYAEMKIFVLGWRDDE